MILVWYPKCSTCKKAKDWHEQNRIAFEERDIKEANPSAKELKEWHSRSGLPLKRFFNTSGLIYRNQNLKEKLPTMSDAEMYKLLATDGMLVKRPIIVGDDFVLVGFNEAAWKEKLC